MKDRTVEQQFRFFLLVLSALIFLGTLAELSLIEHTEGLVQLLPFMLGGLGIGTVLVMLYVPSRRVIIGVRAVMAGIVLGSVFGIYEHVAHNYAFEMEVSPGSTMGEVIWKALGGASPLLAPGMLALAAVLTVIATYHHPALMRNEVA